MKTVIQILLTLVLNALWQGTLVVGFAALGDWLLRGGRASVSALPLGGYPSGPA